MRLASAEASRTHKSAAQACSHVFTQALKEEGAAAERGFYFASELRKWLGPTLGVCVIQRAKLLTLVSVSPVSTSSVRKRQMLQLLQLLQIELWRDQT